MKHKKYLRKGQLESSSTLVKSHLPCPECGSSDALSTYSDGHSYCFSCSTHFNGSPQERDEAPYFPKDTSSLSKQTLAWRGVTKDTMKFFGVYTEVDDKTDQAVSIHYPYGDKAEKVRLLKSKDFHSVGSMKEQGCFGRDKFSSGMSAAITITEGELDALSAFQMLGSKYPTLSVKSSSSAVTDCTKDFEYINGFDKIYLCFDNDKVGQEACRKVASLFDVNKVYHVKMDRFKDANDYLTNNAEKEFVSIWWNAKKFLPKGILSGWQAISETLSQEKNNSIATYPFQNLNELTYGIRLGELILFTAQEKIGKTEVMRAIEYHLAKTTDEKIGIIHLEEEEKRCVEGLIGYHLDIPAHLPDSGLSVDDKIKAYKELERVEGRLHYYTHFGSDDPDSILDIIRYLVAVCGCKFVFLDHITMLVTGFEGDDERKKLDYISTKLAMLTRELNFTLFLVSHVNDNGQTRGSRNIAKVADLIVSLSRDIESADIGARNTTHLLVKGNRFAGTTGPAGDLFFDPKTYTLKEVGIPTHDSPEFNSSTPKVDGSSEVVGFTGFKADVTKGEPVGISAASF